MNENRSDHQEVETMMDKVLELNEKAEQIKEACKIRRSATQKNLAELYDTLVEELSEEMGIAEVNSIIQ